MDNEKIIEDVFDVKDIDPGPHGRVFDKVSRIICSSETFEMDLSIDINVDIYPIELNQKFTIALARSLNPREIDDGTFNQSTKESLADQYEYVMYGKVFKLQNVNVGNKLAVYVSFGGLLMRLVADPGKFKQEIPLDSSIYLLMRNSTTDLL